MSWGQAWAKPYSKLWCLGANIGHDLILHYGVLGSAMGKIFLVPWDVLGSGLGKTLL
jgi:hypothetical protein